MDAETGMDAETRIGCRVPNWMQKPKMDAETQLLYNTINVAYLLFKV